MTNILTISVKHMTIDIPYAYEYIGHSIMVNNSIIILQVWS